MRSWITCTICAVAMTMLAGFVAGQQGPLGGGSGPTVARPRNPAPDDASPAEPAPVAEPEKPRIPSEFSKKKAEPDTTALPKFQSEVSLVTLDVAVLDNKGNFIPGIPGGNFRVLEDNVPQKISKVEMGQAPITVALLIEFSNVFQQYWGRTWYQTLELAFGFANTLQPQDYCAVIAYDMHPEMLSDFTTGQAKGAGGFEPDADGDVVRGQPVRRADRYHRPHVGHRRPQSHRADFLGRGYLQPGHLRRERERPCSRTECPFTPSA